MKSPSANRELLPGFEGELRSQPDPVQQAIAPCKPVLRRLTRLEYNNTIRDLFVVNRKPGMLGTARHQPACKIHEPPDPDAQTLRTPPSSLPVCHSTRLRFQSMAALRNETFG